jgi:hypothetical protein
MWRQRGVCWSSVALGNASVDPLSNLIGNPADKPVSQRDRLREPALGHPQIDLALA